MIQDQLKKGKTPTSLLALQQIADFMTTSMPSMYPAAPQGGMAALNMSKRRGERVCVCVTFFDASTVLLSLSSNGHWLTPDYSLGAKSLVGFPLNITVAITERIFFPLSHFKPH